MRKTKELRTNKGITLIALVITIIVMLILVAVTISMTINGGLIDQAGRAVSETREAVTGEKELASGKIKIGDNWYASIDDYLNNKPIVKSITIEETLKLEIPINYNFWGPTKVTGQLTAKLNNIEGEITWKTNNFTVAFVSNTGLVTAYGDSGTAQITASVTFEGVTYTDTCEVTVYEPTVTAATMQSDLSYYLGKPVDYGVDYDDKSSYGNKEWEIFYADENHIYLITKGYLGGGELPTTGYNGTSDFLLGDLESKYPAVAAGLLNKIYDPTAAGTEEDPYLKHSSSEDNIKRTQYLLDSTVWNKYVNDDYAEWAIGAPTHELFVNSYNIMRPEKGCTIDIYESENGLRYSDNVLGSPGAIPNPSYFMHTRGDSYWIAAPSGYNENSANVLSVSGYDANVIGAGFIAGSTIVFVKTNAFRPVVCLDSDVQITWDSTNLSYTLSKVR